MKNKFFGFIAFAAIAVAAGLNYQQSKQEAGLSDLTMSNIEALADGEGDYDKNIWERFYREDGTGYNCIRGGSETC